MIILGDIMYDETETVQGDVGELIEAVAGKGKIVYGVSVESEDELTVEIANRITVLLLEVQDILEGRK